MRAQDSKAWRWTTIVERAAGWLATFAGIGVVSYVATRADPSLIGAVLGGGLASAGLYTVAPSARPFLKSIVAKFLKDSPT